MVTPTSYSGPMTLPAKLSLKETSETRIQASTCVSLSSFWGLISKDKIQSCRNVVRNQIGNFLKIILFAGRWGVTRQASSSL